jgi:hypothetical protein
MNLRQLNKNLVDSNSPLAKALAVINSFEGTEQDKYESITSGLIYIDPNVAAGALRAVNNGEGEVSRTIYSALMQVSKRA